MPIIVFGATGMADQSHAAVAVQNEIERSQHNQRRFTVAAA